MQNARTTHPTLATRQHDVTTFKTPARLTHAGRTTRAAHTLRCTHEHPLHTRRCGTAHTHTAPDPRAAPRALMTSSCHGWWVLVVRVAIFNLCCCLFACPRRTRRTAAPRSTTQSIPCLSPHRQHPAPSTSITLHPSSSPPPSPPPSPPQTRTTEPWLK